LAQEGRGFSFEMEHIRSEKHGGTTDSENLALSCVRCNQSKGTDIASIDNTTGQLVRFFNPRIDRWSEHFELSGATIEGLTDIGRVTVRLFQFNDAERIDERELLIELGHYPSPEALRRMHPGS